MTRVVAFGVRYLRMRLDDSPLDEFHRAAERRWAENRSREREARP